MSGNGLRPTPAVELGLQLKAERERPRPGRPRGYNKQEVPRDICSPRTLLDVEEGRKKRVTGGLVRDLCAHYETDRELIENLVQLAKSTLRDEWTDAYVGALDKNGWLYQQREDRALSLRFHDSIAIPSLLHTRSYAEMIAQTTRVPEVPDLDWERDLAYRLNRKQRWLESRRRATFVIGEAALLMDVGKDVRQDLRKELLEVAQHPFADVRVLPLSAGRYDLVSWEVSILNFSNGEEPVIRARTTKGAGFVSPDSYKGKFLMNAYDHATELATTVGEYFS